MESISKKVIISLSILRDRIKESMQDSDTIPRSSREHIGISVSEAKRIIISIESMIIDLEDIRD